MTKKMFATKVAMFLLIFVLAGQLWVRGLAAPQKDDEIGAPSSTPVAEESGHLYEFANLGFLPEDPIPSVHSNSMKVNAASINGPAGRNPDAEIIPTLPPVEGRGVELKLDRFPVDMTESSIISRPDAPDASVSMVLDDGSWEVGYGVNDDTYAYQFIWLNRFTPSPTEFPFTLNEIRVMFSDNYGNWDVDVGDAIDLVVYEDADGDPTNGATWLATFNETIQAVDDTTWSVYNLSSPVTLNGPGDVLIGVIDRFVESGVTSKTYVATMDQNTSYDRSWIGWWTADPPDPPQLPPDEYFELLTGDNGGNWLVRGYGETITQEGIYGAVTYKGNPQQGVHLILRFYDGSNWSTWGDPVVTDADGNYLFTGMPTLASGQKYYVRYDNGKNGNPNVSEYLYSWSSFLIDSFVSGSYVHGGNFDIADVVLVSPAFGDSVTLPQAFTWTLRSATTDDSYTFNLIDYNDGDPWYETSLLGYVDSYNLTSLPSGFNFDTEYGWYIRANSPDGGFGYSYNYWKITFMGEEPPGEWVNIMTEDFEGNFPDQWIVFDNNGPDYGEYHWGKRDCQAYQGSYSGWGIGGGDNGKTLVCGSIFPNNVNSWMMYGPFSLEDATDGELRFMLWRNFDSNTSNDHIFYGASINGTEYYGSVWIGSSNGWQEIVFNLKDVYNLGDLRGEPKVWIAFVMETDDDGTNNKSEGAFVDNIVLRMKTLSSTTPGYKSFLPVTIRDAPKFFEGPWEQEPNNNYSEANGLLYFGRTYYGYHNDSPDFFKINTLYGGRLLAKFNSQLTVKDSYGNYVVQLQLRDASHNLIDYVVGPDVEILHSIGPGLYYLYVYTNDGYLDPNKQYELLTEVLFEGPNEQEPNNKLEQANGPLISGTTYRGHHNDIKDYYKIKVTTNGQISAKLYSQLTKKDDAGNYVVQFQLRDKDYNLIEYRVGPDVEISRSIAPGLYYLYVFTRQEFTDDSLLYDLQVTFPQ